MTGRHFGMDWLRIGAFGFLIFYHIGMVFVPWDFHVKARPPVEALEYPMLALKPWRLSLLFLVSGFASRNLIGKLGNPSGFIASRAKRLLVPLFFGIFFIVPPQPWVELMARHSYQNGFWHFYTSDYFRFSELNGIILPTWNHLWFVAYLFVYTVALFGAALALKGQGVRLQSVFDRLFDDWRTLLLPALLLFVIRFWLYPVYGETHALTDDWAAHAMYGFAFLFGFGLARSGAVWGAILRYRKAAYALALTSGTAFVSYGYIPEGAPLLPTMARMVFAWSAIISLLALADLHLNRDHPSRTMWVEAVFPFYIIHQTIIILGYWYTQALHLPWPTEFAILVTMTVTGCWLFYRMGREIPGFRLLIGLSGWRPQPLAKAAAIRPTSANTA